MLSQCRSCAEKFQIYSNTETFLSVVVSQSISGPVSITVEGSFDIGVKVNIFGVVSYVA